MMLILATYRRLTTMDRMVREGRWSDGRPLLYQYPRLMGQTLGLIAFGHVARAVAVRARAFGFHILAYDPYVEELVISQYGVEPVNLTELLQRSDIVSMHAPATADAHHMMKEHHFRLMKPEALFISTGRGPTTDEAALIKALKEGWIAAAGLDVFETEPIDPNNPLLKMENVILTPHAASASARFDPVRKRRVGAELALVLSGRWPRSCVNPAVLEKSQLVRWQPYSMEPGPGAYRAAMARKRLVLKDPGRFSDPANLTWERYVALQARERERYLAERATISPEALSYRTVSRQYLERAV